MKLIRKAVIPAAGLGTRMLPTTKVIPKEMLNVGRKPMIQYSVEEAVAAGIREICIVINKSKTLIQEYFSETEAKLRSFREIRNLDKLVSSCKIVFIHQPEPTGLAEAIMRSKDFVGTEPFATMLPDYIYLSREPAIAQLFPAYERCGKNVVGLMKIKREEAYRFGNCGIIRYRQIKGKVFEITKLKGRAPPSSGIGKQMVRSSPRYIFNPEVFDYIAQLKPSIRGEFDDVPIIRKLIENNELVGRILKGRIYDVGNFDGYLAANRYLSTWKPPVSRTPK